MKSSPQTSGRPSPNRTLVIMAKAPRPGMVKTRLSPGIPAADIVALYRCLLEDTVVLANSLSGVECAVMCPEPDKQPLTDMLGKAMQIVSQNGDGLAAGLTSVFRRFTADGASHVIAFNSDSPHLAPSVLHTAFHILTTHDVVVGPTHDGGYYLVGAKADHPSLFEGDGMGTGSALEKLMKRTELLGLSTAFTEPFYDIDVETDLIQLSRELQLAPARAPRTAAWLQQWTQRTAHSRTGAEGL